MKSARLISVSVLKWALGGLAGLVLGVGCASFTPYGESVLIEAGFQPVGTSSSAAYAALPAYKVMPIHGPNGADYGYRNEAKGITYLGSKAEYERYEELIQEKGRQRVDVVNQEMNQQGLHMR